MDLGERCSIELEKLVRGHQFYNDLYFSLDDIKRLPEIIRNLNHIKDIVISPFHITDESIMEAY